MAAGIPRAIGFDVSLIDYLVAAGLQQLPNKYAADRHLLFFSISFSFLQCLPHKNLGGFVLQHEDDKIINRALSSSSGSRRVGS